MASLAPRVLLGTIQRPDGRAATHLGREMLRIRCGGTCCK
jgi:hypothetical protein